MTELKQVQESYFVKYVSQHPKKTPQRSYYATV